VWFDSWPGEQQPWLFVVVVFVVAAAVVVVVVIIIIINIFPQFLRVSTWTLPGHNCLLPHPLEFIIHSHLFIKFCIICPV
jgi:hypothetical protein